MKVKALTRLMNNHGTNPRIKILKHDNNNSILTYEGKPDNMDDEVANLSVKSFTVLGTGFLEIHTC